MFANRLPVGIMGYFSKMVSILNRELRATWNRYKGQPDNLHLLNVVSRMKKNYTTERDKGHDIETLARSVTDRKQFNSELFQDLDKSL